MKVLFAAVNAKYVHTSLSVRYLKNYVKNKGIDAKFLEFTINETKDSVLRKLYMSNADVYGFSCYIWNIGFVLSVARDLKLLKPECKIIFGGPEVSFDGEELLEKYPFVDVVVCGEGEEMVAKILKSGDFSRRVVFGTPDIPPDELDFPYTDEDLEACVKGEKLIYYETTRGCPYSCAYCLSSVTHGVRYRNIDLVKAEIKKMTDAGALTIKFADRTFNADKKRAAEIWEFCSGLEGKTKYHFEIGADLIDEECLSILKEVPKDKFQFEIGVQSTNLKTLDSVSRKTDLEKLKKNVRALRELDNIHLHLDLIAGLPFEDYESFGRSFNELFELKPHELQLGFLKFLKGSKIRRDAENFGGIYSAEAPYGVLCTDYLSAGDVIRLKNIEDVFERYYNSGRFLNSLFYAAEIFATPFEFFEKLAEFFDKKDLIGQGVKRISLYGLFYEFMKENTDAKSLEKFRLLMKKDFECWHSNGVGTPDWYKL